MKSRLGYAPHDGIGRNRAALRLAASAWLTAAVLYLASEAAAAAAFSPRYSYARNYISDLGVPACGADFAGRAICSPLHWLMNGNFVAQGLLFLVGALAAAFALATPARYALVACAVLNGIGIVLVGLYPETAGPLHGLGALLAIVFGNATAFVSAFAFRELRLAKVHHAASLVLPVLAALSLGALLTAQSRGTAIGLPDGVWERASVYTITAWEVLTAACLAARIRGASRSPT